MGSSANDAVLAVAINDLIFETKIRTTADRLGVSTVTARDPAQIGDLLEKHNPTLLMVDLNTLGPQVVDVVRAGCTHSSKPFVLAFVSHVDERLAKEASAAGAHQVMPRSKFSTELPDIISKHCCKTD